MTPVLISLALALNCAPALEISAASAPPRHLRLGSDARFSVTYMHSMYLVPFTEDYVVDAGRIRLDNLRSPDGTVMDYYALEGTPGEVRALNRRFSSIAFGIAAKNPQTLTIGKQKWSFLEFGASSSEVVFKPITDCPK